MGWDSVKEAAFFGAPVGQRIVSEGSGEPRAVPIDHRNHKSSKSQSSYELVRPNAGPLTSTGTSAVRRTLHDADVTEASLPPTVNFSRADTRTYANTATLDPNDEVARQWLADVRRYLPAGDVDPIAALRAIHRVYKEQGFQYLDLIGLPSDDGRVVKDVNPPGRLLRTRTGRCIDSSLLTAATLRALGVPFVLIRTVGHHVAAAIVEPKRARSAGDLIVEVPLNKNKSSRRKTIFLAPLDLNPVGMRGADFATAAGRGRFFLTQELDNQFLVFVGKDGEILKGRFLGHGLWYRPTPALGAWAPPLRSARRQKKSMGPQF